MKSPKYLISKKSIFELTNKLFCYVILLAIAFLILYPLLEKCAKLFMSYDDLLDSTVMYIPKVFSTENIKLTVTAMQYWQSLFNTTAISLLVAILQVFTCTFIAYGFARFKFPGRNILFLFVIIVLLVPVHIIMTPLYMKFRFFDIFGIIKFFTGKTLNLLDTIAPFTFLSLTGLGIKNSLYIYLLRQYFRGIPMELEEAGKIDGGGAFCIFFRIMLPNAIPMMITIFLFSFSWQWTDSLYTSLFFKDFTVLPNSLSYLLTYRLQDLQPILRTAMVDIGIIFVIAPLLLVYAIGQRFFVQGFERSGIVG